MTAAYKTRGVGSSLVVLMLLYGGLGRVKACVAPDCDHPDKGSCGTACCKLSFTMADKSEYEVALAFNQSIINGGPDSRFYEVELAEGVRNVADLRPFNVGVSFIGQTVHTTAKRLYNDTINFTISRSEGNNGSYVKVFSISQIGGAYGDEGQNFKNIAVLMKSVFQILGLDYNYTHVDDSCPAKEYDNNKFESEG
eukprot:CAMPEP_0184503826 /NCGR_PEP_ID=MMETSP0113_2-20130426/52114_1 /TAXON_ID=91329 /ORGANISM="Norrisiella sphaerica, Strain BC52" /LENGTH=195 /DNA_ID=CAMNT_0026893383 /DNA_START=117 /DNA_END=704 /DNA_ORIENTATION=-